jgi:hypothetical protein
MITLVQRLYKGTLEKQMEVAIAKVGSPSN